MVKLLFLQSKVRLGFCFINIQYLGLENNIKITIFISTSGNTTDEGGKICYEVQDGARLHFISFETRQIEKVHFNLKSINF